MPNKTPASRRSGLDFAQKVARLAAVAPDPVSKKAAFSAANWLRRYYGLSDDDKMAEIIAALMSGCSNYEDLVEETKIHRSDIVTLVKQLERVGDVKIRTLVIGDRGGRRPIYISLAGEKLPKNKRDAE